MLFGATFACADCRLRFARRERCPSCGGPRVFALTTREGRTRYRKAAQRRVGWWQGLLLRSARWAPEGWRLAIPVGGGLLAALPALIAYRAYGASAFQELWLMSDLTQRYQGLSSRGLGLLGIAAGGLLLASLALASRLGALVAVRQPRSPPSRTRVFEPPAEARGDTTLTGVARRASAEIASGLAGEPCLLFGLRGTAGDADVADADGGDFDLELPSGERVMVSLEHALLEAGRGVPESEPAPEIGGALGELLEQRAISAAEGRAILEELLVCDGDEVTVTGSILGGRVTSLGYRGASGARVLAGDAERPVRVTPRAESPRSA